MYQALYRKWRPKTFDDVVGQEAVTGVLRRQVAEGRVSHAYLFVGTRGTGKTTCAKILSRAVNCEHPVNGNPCNCCRSCLGIEDGSILDVEEIDAASNNGVDNIRALRDEAVFSPAEVRKRVYIVDEVHMLSASAFNALLKILEEPPEHLIFILATTELKKVPATILSRCQRFQFRRISEEAMRGRLCTVAEKEGLQLTEEAADLLARLAEGSLRDGLSLLDQCAWEGTIDIERVNATVGLAGAETTRDLLSALRGRDAAAALRLLDEAWREGKDMASVLGELSSLLRDALILRITGDGESPLMSGFFAPELVRETADGFSEQVLSAFLGELESAIQEMTRSSQRRMVAELCLVRLARGEGSDTSDLSRRVSLLEERLSSGLPMGSVPQMQPSPVPTPKTDRVERPRQEPVKPPERRETPTPPAFGEAPEAAKAQPAPSPVAQPAPGEGDTVDWKRILETAKPELSRVSWRLLGNPAYLTAKLSGARLELGIYNETTLEMLNQDKIKEALAQAVKTLTGRPAVVEMSITKPQSAQRNLEELDRFIKLKGLE